MRTGLHQIEYLRKEQKKLVCNLWITSPVFSVEPELGERGNRGDNHTKPVLYLTHNAK